MKDLIEKVYKEGISRADANIHYSENSQRFYQKYCEEIVLNHPHASEEELFHNARNYASYLIETKEPKQWTARL